MSKPTSVEEILQEYDTWCKCGAVECLGSANYLTAKAKINRLIAEARIDAYADCGSKGGNITEVRAYAKSRAHEYKKELGDSND